MGILNSLISLAVIVGAGYVTITYISPKIEGKPSGTDDAKKIVEDIAGVVSGETPAVEDKPKKEKKGKGEWLSGDKTGKDNKKKKGGGGEESGGKSKGGEEEKSSKKEKAKKEMLYAYFNYGPEDYYMGDEYWDY